MLPFERIYLNKLNFGATNMITKIPTREGELIKEGPEIETTKAINSNEDLFRLGIIKEFVKNSGQFVILPEGTKILNRILTLIDVNIRKELGFEELILPKMVPIDTVRKADILRKWDNYLIVAKPFSSTKGVKEDYILDPLQCTAAYQLMENEIIDISNSPRKWFDKSGPTYRNEDLDKIKPCVKQREFHRAEFIYLGTKEQVIDIREKCLEQLEKICEELGLRYRVVVGSGCYQLKNGEIKMPESLEEIPIKDLEIFIPHEDKWMELAGSAILTQTQTSRFNISGKNGEQLWSGCTGIGLERFIYAVVSNGKQNNL
jgi:seryl-tRNA synthetase